MPIPAWTAKGVIAPVDIAAPASPRRSPYRVTLEDLVQRFATSLQRCEILDGFLRYRAALNAAGMTAGFQWLDGSFLEDIETIESRPPKDLDVVTYFLLQPGQTQAQLAAGHPALFPATPAARIALKAQYKVDAYVVDLRSSPQLLVRKTTYWYSMWSHRRNEIWKGYVELDLASGADAGAAQLLAGIAAGFAPAAAVALNPPNGAAGGGA